MREINNKGNNKLFYREHPQVNKRKKYSPIEDINSEIRKRSRMGELAYAEVCKAGKHTNKELINDNICSECDNEEEWQVDTKRRKPRNDLRNEKVVIVGRELKGNINTDSNKYYKRARHRNEALLIKVNNEQQWM
jgi:hypothetical protein